ncbi:hypothetical protein [Pseudonocardia sediminis]|uniref:hypothetical protein n=1 Tax=Pseudonocardia sediminis TaxID=1397368 RepID=UPI0013EF00A2|nr:hypothetical protein [Pseudonocardia sediminis]
MNVGDAAAIHDVIAADALRRTTDPEAELTIWWRRHCDRRRHERTTGPGSRSEGTRNHG